MHCEWYGPLLCCRGLADVQEEGTEPLRAVRRAFELVGLESEDLSELAQAVKLSLALQATPLLDQDVSRSR